MDPKKKKQIPVDIEDLLYSIEEGDIEQPEEVEYTDFDDLQDDLEDDYIADYGEDMDDYFD